MNWKDRISTDPQVCHGKACIAGTRVLASVIIDNFASEISTEAIRENYPSLVAEDVQPAIWYAAEQVRNQFLPPDSSFE